MSAPAAALDAVSQPTLQFPEPFLRSIANSVMHAGATVNGESSELTATWRNVGNSKW